MPANKETDVTVIIDGYVKKAQKALDEFMSMTQEQVDAIVKEMTLAGLKNHMELARLAVEETGRGVYEDKITKNMFATEYIYHSIKHEFTAIRERTPPISSHLRPTDRRVSSIPIQLSTPYIFFIISIDSRSMVSVAWR